MSKFGSRTFDLNCADKYKKYISNITLIMADLIFLPIKIIWVECVLRLSARVVKTLIIWGKGLGFETFFFTQLGKYCSDDTFFALECTYSKTSQQRKTSAPWNLFGGVEKRRSLIEVPVKKVSLNIYLDTLKPFNRGLLVSSEFVCYYSAVFVFRIKSSLKWACCEFIKSFAK